MAGPAGTDAAHRIDCGPHDAVIGAELAHQRATLLVRAAPAHHYAVVSDTNVAPLHAGALVTDLKPHGRVSLHVIPAGEQHKTRETWAAVSDELLAAGCGRDTTVVALGGGVVGDLAGFVAATYMRGVPVVQCPTSLLAMIDASIGGKTGVDTPGGKNLIGAFHHPALMIADVATIATLPLAHRRAGLAEAIKHGVIADADYFAWLDAALDRLLGAEPTALRHCVHTSLEIKRLVVQADPREQGVRRTLNFGHTLGHALELVSDFTLAHGEAVAIGMVLEARLAERLALAPAGIAAELEQVVTRAGLPATRPAALDARAILAATRTDKKASGGVVTYSLPADIGTMAAAHEGWRVAVDDALVLEVLA